MLNKEVFFFCLRKKKNKKNFALKVNHQQNKNKFNSKLETFLGIFASFFFFVLYLK